MTPEEIVAAEVARRWLEEEFGVPDCSCGEPGCPGETREEKARSLAALITEERAEVVRWCEGLARDEVPGTADEAADRIKREFPECFGEEWERAARKEY